MDQQLDSTNNFSNNGHINLEPVDIKPTICIHGLTVETCDDPGCANFAISKILDSLQNCDRQSEGGNPSPLVAEQPVFEFQGPTPTSPSQWEDFTFEFNTLPASAALTPIEGTGQRSESPMLAGTALTCGRGVGLAPAALPAQSAPHPLRCLTPTAAASHSALSSRPAQDVLRCKMQRSRHPSASYSEASFSSSERSAPSPHQQVSTLFDLFFLWKAVWDI